MHDGSNVGESQGKDSHGVYLKRTIMVNAGALLGVTFIEKAGGKQMLFSLSLTSIFGSREVKKETDRRMR